MIVKNIIIKILVTTFFFIFYFALNASDNFYLTADSIKKDDKANTITAIGKVSIINGEIKLKADKIIYNTNKKEVFAIGNVIIFSENDDILYAKKAKLNDNLESGFIKNIGVLLSNESRLAASSAISIKKKNKVIYNNVVFTNCTICDQEKSDNFTWKLKAKKATHLKKSKILLYEDVYLEFFKIPVLYVPIFYHPDPTVKNKTGLLRPKFSSSSIFGDVYSQPIFFNISEKSNLTLRTTLSSKEGLLVFNDYKNVNSKYALNLKSSITHGSKERLNEPNKKLLRGHLDLNYAKKVNSDLIIGANIKKSSDPSYLARYGFSEGESVLNQNAFLELGNIYKNISLDFFKFQSLSTNYTTSKLPFIRPYILAQWNNLNNSKRKRNQLNKIIISSVTRSNKQNVDSVHFENHSSKNYIFNGLLLKDLTKLNLSLYSKNGTSSNESIIKLFPQTGIELQYPFIKYKKNESILLEPRVQFFISPDDYKNYKIRNEDSNAVDLSSSNLFDSNRYSGLDRIESGTRANYGVALKKVMNNGDILSSSIGQSYNTNKQQLFNSDSGFKEKRSEIIGDIFLNNSTYDLNYDYRLSEDLTLNRNSLEALIKKKKIEFNISYIQLKNFSSAKEDDTEYIQYGMSKNILQNWNFNISQTRDLAGAKYATPMRTTSSIDFTNDCTLVQIKFVRDNSYDVDIPTETNLSFSIKLFGF